ncbi:hypothetical protein [Rhizobium leguminosarum]|nr:hypothetical protein [Rhizobium leguminosarum]
MRPVVIGKDMVSRSLLEGLIFVSVDFGEARGARSTRHPARNT